MCGQLEQLGLELANTESDLEPCRRAYENFVEDYKAGLWQQHVDDGKKMPAEDVRLALAHRAMPSDLLGSFTRLKNRKSRCEAAIQRTRAQIEAKRSILSALKEGLV